jgi:hypothetical protein
MHHVHNKASQNPSMVKLMPNICKEPVMHNKVKECIEIGRINIEDKNVHHTHGPWAMGHGSDGYDLFNSYRCQTSIDKETFNWQTKNQG